MHTLILASTSPYRRQLLERFDLEFETVAPEVTEGHLDGELPVDRAARLSIAKALAIVCFIALGLAVIFVAFLYAACSGHMGM